MTNDRIDETWLHALREANDSVKRAVASRQLLDDSQAIAALSLAVARINEVVTGLVVLGYKRQRTEVM